MKQFHPVRVLLVGVVVIGFADSSVRGNRHRFRSWLADDGEDVSPAEELRTAISGFVSEFKTFSTGVDAKLQKQEDRMNKLDRKTMMAGRPALASRLE